MVGPHPYPDMVARFQSIISAEIKLQLQEQTGSELPTAVVACVGGGSNAAGAFYQFLSNKEVRLIAVEAAGEGVDSGETAATLARGREGLIHGSKTMLMQTEDGQIVEPYSISAGLDYPGIGPAYAHWFKEKRVEFMAATDEEALASAKELCRLEGIIPELESAHAFAAIEKLNPKEQDSLVICLSGRGDKDMATYQEYLKRTL